MANDDKDEFGFALTDSGMLSSAGGDAPAPNAFSGLDTTPKAAEPAAPAPAAAPSASAPQVDRASFSSASQAAPTSGPAASLGSPMSDPNGGRYSGRGVGRSMLFAQGGAIPDEDDESPMMDTFGANMQGDINAAMGVLRGVLDYGRQLHGLGGGEQHAGNIPTKPFNETPKPQPMMPPSSLPYGPNEKPFGKRSEGESEGGAIEMAGVLPGKPYSETPKPQPMPGPLPPTSNPFGKRAEAEEEEPQEPGAIDTEETA